MNLDLRQLTRSDLALMHGLLDLFGQAFDDSESYCLRRPSPEYLQRLLGSDSFVALVALERAVVVAGLAAYDLHKFEQERSGDLHLRPRGRRDAPQAGARHRAD